MAFFIDILVLTLMNKMVWLKKRHRTIVEHGLTLLAFALMPIKYWDEAFRASVYLNNRLPTFVLHHKTPLEVLFKTLPNYSFLKIFGCFYFPNIRSYNKHKLQFRSIECTFLGYSLNHKGYKCLDSNGKIIISRDFIFNESSFPFAHKIQSSLSNFVWPSFHHSTTPSIISSFGSFTHLEIVQSVTNVLAPTVSPLATNTYDNVASHGALS